MKFSIFAFRKLFGILKKGIRSIWYPRHSLAGTVLQEKCNYATLSWINSNLELLSAKVICDTIKRSNSELLGTVKWKKIGFLDAFSSKNQNFRNPESATADTNVLELVVSTDLAVYGLLYTLVPMCDCLFTQMFTKKLFNDFQIFNFQIEMVASWIGWFWML